MCNVFCNVEECGFDGGDCGVGLATQKLPILNVEFVLFFEFFAESVQFFDQNPEKRKQC